MKPDIQTLKDMEIIFQIFGKARMIKILLALSNAEELRVYEIKKAIGDPEHNGNSSIALKQLEKLGIVTSGGMVHLHFIDYKNNLGIGQVV